MHSHLYAWAERAETVDTPERFADQVTGLVRAIYVRATSSKKKLLTSYPQIYSPPKNHSRDKTGH
jgi:hypothetical protein